jgi:formylmethanofuran dehydrogenase subunit E
LNDARRDDGVPTPPPSKVRALLERSSRTHSHACPRQILGIRMTLAATALLGLDLPREDKRVLAVAETDGCFLSGIETAGGLFANRRTLRVIDVGRVAATFVDVKTEEAWRLAPHPEVRERSLSCCPDAKHRFGAMMEAYVEFPTEALLTWEKVTLVPGVKTLVGRPHVRVTCAGCGEEVINERETLEGDQAYCPACRGGAYYRLGS